MEIEYPSVDDIIKANKRAIELLRATKAEKHKLLAPRKKIEEILDAVKKDHGTIKKKAAILLTELNRQHFFASANKRTSFIVASDFLLTNEGQIPLKRKEDVKFLIEVRQGSRTLEEVIRWLNE